MASRFVHLHTHSHYTFLQALPKVEELVNKAKEEGMDALALTDSGNMHGAIEFYKAAIKAGIKPILGVDGYLSSRSRFKKDRVLDTKWSRIVLLAEKKSGYHNLLKLVTKSWTEGFFERPRMDKELLREYSKDLIVLLPSFSSDTSQLLRANDTDGAAAALEEFKSLFGAENVFLEITHHSRVAGHEALMERVIALARQTKTHLVAQQDVYYLRPEDREPTEVMRRIKLGGQIRENEDEDFSFISEKRALELFVDTPEAIDATCAIADRCNISFELGKWTFPAVPVSSGFKDHNEELRAKAYEHIETRGLAKTKQVIDRLEYELKIILDKGFAVYYLIVADLFEFARRNGILTTTRGSAAGSLVAYLTGISNIDPLYYKLPFERFLNPERPKAPDIDMDMADDRRDDMIAYTRERYGKDRVAQVGTFGTLLARAAVRDVARALGHSYTMGDRIAKLIPPSSQGFPMTIDRAFELEPDLKTLYDEEDEVREILDIAKRIEGCVRHVGVHAAGVVVAPTPLIEWTPLQPDPKETGKLITQYDMYSITDEYGGVGLLKFDFLGIKNLSILADAVTRVRQTRGIEIDIENIPLDDVKTFEMLARGDTYGTFQLGGSGLTRYFKDLKPTTIHDLNAMVALYRPGPIETIPSYIERKHNPRLIRYLDPRMKDYLEFSYGLLIYQDDVLLTAISLAGYSWLEADTLRKAMGKKIPRIMRAEKEKLIKGFVEYGKLSKQKAEQLWKLIEPFAAYGFNKAHAASYGRVAYQTAYMKANYPIEYMAALLTADSGDTEEIARLVAEAANMKISVLPPDVNESGTDFTIIRRSMSGVDNNYLSKNTFGESVPHEQDRFQNAIRFGLNSIKNFGEGVARIIIEERIAHGVYTSLSDFLTRVPSALNRKALESLIKCGALDTLEQRCTLLANIEVLLAFHRDSRASAPQDSLFGKMMEAPTLMLSEGPPISLSDRLAWEKELLGIYISGHPLDAHTAVVKKAHYTIAELKNDPQSGLPIILPALIASLRTVVTRNGEKMAFLKLEDATENIEAVVFPKLFKQHSAILASGACILADGKISLRNGEISVTLERLRLL